MPLFVQTAMVKDMDAATIQNMGVHLSTEDVAQVVYQQANGLKKKNSASEPIRIVQLKGGLKAKTLMQLSSISLKMEVEKRKGGGGKRRKIKSSIHNSLLAKRH